MNKQIVTQSVAYAMGKRDAEAGNARDAATVFTGEKDQANYQAGVDSVAKPAKKRTPNYSRSNGREYVTRTEQDANAMLQLAERHGRRIIEMIEKTALETPQYAGDILWA